MVFRPTADIVRQRLHRGVLLLVVCGLCGTFDILNNNFARWVARASSMPEEEESHAKDRATQVAAAQPVRRGGLRPRAVGSRTVEAHRGAHATTLSLIGTSNAAQPRTGAGIFQHC
ncbi:MAG TPA: hypothetical protein VKD90_02845 [Gemmataceae bacterium]|nr:hypothetical protein [Gemmataceae bacterium]